MDKKQTADTLKDALDFLKQFKYEDIVVAEPNNANPYKLVFSVSEGNLTVKFMSDAKDAAKFFAQLQNGITNSLLKISVNQFGKVKIIYDNFMSNPQ